MFITINSHKNYTTFNRHYHLGWGAIFKSEKCGIAGVAISPADVYFSISILLICETKLSRHINPRADERPVPGQHPTIKIIKKINEKFKHL
jgi:hypothetical protein